MRGLTAESCYNVNDPSHHAAHGDQAMSDKQKLLAAGKVALGGLQMASGALTMLGHGLLAGRISPAMRMTAGRVSCQNGKKRFDEGIQELSDKAKP
jgi:hypothetical protein